MSGESSVSSETGHPPSASDDQGEQGDASSPTGRREVEGY